MEESYAGPERRIHRLYVTRNTEYHFRGDRCVAVRDRKTRTWLPAHLAVNRRLSGAVRLLPSGCAVPTDTPPSVGESLYFGDDGRELVTSTVCDIRRPEREVVALYPS
ncbi:MAG: hypothetical protein DIU78_006975 [Pseudomonadota bacterium]|nr:MAG: hypothetical protein DIU78_15410 [Pseudomonadota bacterium]